MEQSVGFEKNNGGGRGLDGWLKVYPGIETRSKSMVQFINDSF